MERRIAMVSEHASPLAALGGADAGGQNVHVAALSWELAARGAEVVVHTRRDDPALPSRRRLADGLSVHHVDAGPARELPKDELLPYMREFAARLAESWSEWRPDIVHAHFWMSGHAALIAAREVGVPVVQTFHALGAVKRRYQGRADTSPEERAEIEQAVIARADRIIATCTDEVSELMRLGADRERIATIPCGVDLRLFGPDGPREPVLEGRRRLLYVGRLVERKGIGDVIAALASLPRTELVIAGGPPQEALDRDPEVRRLRGLARAAGVEERVVFRGRVSREAIPALIRSADAVVTVPWYEPFGMVPLEAMACGVPVIASAVGGMLDSIVDGETGVHVPPRDPARLAEEAVALLDDRERRRRMGHAGSRRAASLYDWRSIAARTSDVYEGLIGERRMDGHPIAMATETAEMPAAPAHLAALEVSLPNLAEHAALLADWGRRLAKRLLAGGRLLAAGNGGSAAEAQHLTAEIVGRFQSEKPPLSAIPLHGDTSSLTAIANDYGGEQAFARQVRAHGRPDDVLVLLSTSGESENLIEAARAASEIGMASWALTGGGPNRLTAICDEAIAVDAPSGATVQELHLVAVHMLCEATERHVERALAGAVAQEARR